ncbi:MAG TPA: 4Fe-4S binding protein [Candidatus Omnitrophota bacterium]|nr:4Fe-4S binding protein [Candidatus Omnitrophota bacterium]HPT07154.1 4Fe-4S binding protein [Candidatus Omnitrophota bacterium]
MIKVFIDRQRCKGCLLCVSVCPRKSIAVDEKLNAKGIRPVVMKQDYDCIGCKSCVLVCPECAITIIRE